MAFDTPNDAQVDTQNPPAQPQIAAPAAPPQAAPTAAPEPGSSFRHLAPAMIGAILGHAAGRPAPTRYTTDPNGKIVALPSAPESTSDKIRRIAAHALTGLAASGNAPDEKSGLAKGLAGAGAGAKAVTEQDERQDALQRARAKEDFDQEQKSMLQKHQIMVGNTTAVRNLMEMRKLQVDADPTRQAGIALGDAAQKANIPGAETISDAEWQARLDASDDKEHFLATHLHFPAGFTPDTLSEDGQIVKQGSGQVVVIPATVDGNIPLPAAYLEQVKRFAPLTGQVSKTELEQIQEGHEVSPKQLAALRVATEQGNKIWLEGESKPTLSYPTGKDGQPDLDHPTLVNSVTREPIQAMKAGQVPSEAVEEKAKREDTEAQSKLRRQQGDEAEAKAADARAQAALAAKQLNLMGGGVNQESLPAYMDALGKLKDANPVAYGVLLNVKNPVTQADLLTVANADAPVEKLFPTRTTAKSGQMDAQTGFGLAKMINPKLTHETYATKQKALTDFSTGEDGKAIASFNQFFVHAADLKAASERLQRTNSPWLNKPLNELKSKGMGQPGVPALMVAVQTTRSEWQNFIKNGHAADLADSEQGRQIMSDASSPVQILDAAQEMGLTGIGRLDQLDAKWRRTWGGHYPGLISDTGRQAIQELGLGDKVKQYPTESGAMGGVQPQGGASDNSSQLTHKVMGPDGKMHLTNAAGTIDGGVAP